MTKPNLIAAYLVDNSAKNDPLYLLLKRSQTTYLPGIWQMVTGKIENDETATYAAIRETQEETGLKTSKLYNVDVTMFYNQHNAEIAFSANFCAFSNSHETITLSPNEHSEYKWCTFEEAQDLLAFPSQKETLSFVHKRFVINTPDPVNEVEICALV